MERNYQNPEPVSTLFPLSIDNGKPDNVFRHLWIGSRPGIQNATADEIDLGLLGERSEFGIKLHVGQPIGYCIHKPTVLGVLLPKRLKTCRKDEGE
jgi:hypothetical protein